MSTSSLLELADAGEFRRLFIDELGWNNPDRSPLTYDLRGNSYLLTQVAGYKGLRIWVCNALPDKKTQREIDQLVGQDNLERLVIFAGTERQEWRWPRRAQTGGVNAKLLMHRHLLGGADAYLDRQLRAIEIDLDAPPSLVDLLSRMRAAFDIESESASVQAARLMGTLYGELAASQVDPDDATLLLARLLFLLFGDDSGMWKKDLFHNYLIDQTSGDTLHRDLNGLFVVLSTEENRRNLAPGSALADFRYINGGLFEKQLVLSNLTTGFHAALLSACEFDWQVISPAVFGSMFQTVKDKEARRNGGEHYTTEENILRTIGPLFLDELRQRLNASWDHKGQLTKLHNEIGRLKFLDPACGCGNFLVVAYRELRALELELLIRRRDLDQANNRSAGRNLSQKTFDVTGDIKVSLDHFYGIEIEEWPARIAETAMLLVDHLANQRMEEDFGIAPDRLPIKLAPTIVHDNALRTDWRRVLELEPAEPADDVVVLGNPPFVGMAWLTRAQQEDNRVAFASLRTRSLRTGRLDYVASWYAKAIALLAGSKGRASFVSTNSITQGEQARSMVPLLEQYGFKVDFGHRTFKWTSEAKDAAVVHVVIVGFSATLRSVPKRLFDYPTLTSKPIERTPERLNFYLVDGPDLAPVKVAAPLATDMPMASKGSQATDGGNLLVNADEYEEVVADPIGRRYLRRFVQGQDLLSGKPRWCLWLVGASLDELQSSEVVAARLERVRAARSESPTTSVKAQARTPHLFTQIRQPQEAYIVLPVASSESREWIPGAILPAEMIAGDQLIVFRSSKLWHLAYLQSSIYMGWLRTFAGRFKSDIRISPGLAYFPFPFIVPTGESLSAIDSAAKLILDERLEYSDASLAALYAPQRMPASLRARHLDLDEQIDSLYGLSRPTEAERMTVILEKYEALVAAMGSDRKSGRAGRD
ncbi:MAG: DNA methyltransferase [Jatrophihabitantaceae bacterium]